MRVSQQVTWPAAETQQWRSIDTAPLDTRVVVGWRSFPGYAAVAMRASLDRRWVAYDSYPEPLPDPDGWFPLPALEWP